MLLSVITEGAMVEEEVVFIKIEIPVDFLDGRTTIRLIYSVEVQVRNRVCSRQNTDIHLFGIQSDN